MEVGAEVWYKDKVDGWVPAIVTKRDDTTGQIKFTVQIKKNGGKTKEDYNALANKDQEIDNLKLMNTSEDSEVENLINLPFLHEPAILHCLQLRYNRSEIYTYTGPILIAVNPFKKVNLYGDQILQKYFNYGLQKSQGVIEDALSPHPFAIADAAYRFMMSAIDSSYGLSDAVAADQSILISGESGAGKTETTKIVLRYLTTIASDSRDIKMEGSIMDKVLKSNPILEALGNAKTIRNDNSSRFGKFIELKFNGQGHLVGGFIRTYLLEKVRLTSQQLNERNFHIFYQMGVGGGFEERWAIQHPRDFYYVNQGQCFGIERINDESDYQDLRQALKVLKFDEDEQICMFDILAGLLHLGQIKFDGFHVKGEDACETAKDELSTKSLANAMRLLGIPSQAFLKTVTERTIVARDDVYQKRLTSVQASDARDSIARIVYGKLFDWVVAMINDGIKTDPDVFIRSEIAVLDIFGFECLTENSFEQLCINYTNETLQQQFNQFIFKQEQQIYEEEEIEWSFITFPDNQDCLDLIDNKKKSIFRMLDDECMTAAGSDVKFAGRLINELGDYSRLSMSVQQKVSQQFSINHYAGEVVYTVKTFVDKNKDELPREAIELMSSATQPLLKLIFMTNFAPNPLSKGTIDGSSTFSSPTKGNALTSPTICTQFKAQLGSLMAKINSTKPHYIRCIKPNDQSKADTLNRLRTTEQLRYGGVLEAVRVARSGFPVRFTHEEFFGRYRPLANPFNAMVSKMPRYLSAKISEGDAAKACSDLLNLLWDTSSPKPAPSDKKQAQTLRRIAEVEYWRGSPNRVESNSIQLGKTRVFLRKPAHDLFESRRSRNALVCSRRIQASVRKWLGRIRYIRTLKAISRLQIAIRYFLFHHRFVKKRRNNAATRIQTVYRRHLHRSRLLMMISALVSLQTVYRGELAKRRTFALLNTVRLARRHALMRDRAVTALQCRFRVKDSKKVLRQLKIDAKDVVEMRERTEQLRLELERQRSEEKAREGARMLREAQEREREEARLRQEFETAARVAAEARIREEQELAALAAARAKEMEESRTKAMQTANEALTHTNVTLEERLRELLARVAILEKENWDLRATQGALDAKVSGLETVVDLKEKELIIMAAKYEGLTTKPEEMELIERENKELKVEKAVLEARLIEADTAISELKNRLKTIESDSGVQSSKVRELEIAAAVAAAAADSSKALHGEESGQLASTKFALSESEKEKAVLEKVNEHLEDSLRDHRQQIHDLEVQNAKKDDIIAASANQTARQRFTASIDAFRRDMMEGQGIAGKVYTMAYPPTDSVLVVKKAYTLCFIEPKNALPSKSRFFSAPPVFPEIPSVNAYDIREVQTGLTKEAIAMFPAISEKALAGNLFVTVMYSPSMVLAVEVRSLDDRNFLVKGLRALVTEMQLNASASERDALEIENGSDTSSPLNPQESLAKLSAQVLLLSHDIAQKDEELIAMRNVAKNHEMDDIVRGQLSKRLEEILIQLEDARQGKVNGGSRVLIK